MALWFLIRGVSCGYVLMFFHGDHLAWERENWFTFIGLSCICLSTLMR